MNDQCFKACELGIDSSLLASWVTRTTAWVSNWFDVSSITLFRFAVCFQTAQFALWCREQMDIRILKKSETKMTAQKLKEPKYHSQSKRHQRRHELTNLKIHEDYWQRCDFRKLAFSLIVFQSSFLLFVTVSYGASGKMFVWHETVILSVTSKLLANVKFLTA